MPWKQSRSFFPVSSLFELSKNRQLRQALALFPEILRAGEPLDESIFSCTVKACACAGDVQFGKGLHGCSLKLGLDGHVSVGTSLVDLYMKFGALEDGKKTFELMPFKNVVSWSSLLTGYVHNGEPDRVLEIFSRMAKEGVKPNAYSFASLLTASAGLQDLGTGRQAHAQAFRCGFQSAVFVCNSLVSMYAKCDYIGDAGKVFEEMPERDSVTWNAMVAGLVQNGLDEDALAMFGRMRGEGAELTQLSFAAVLKACGRVGAIGFACQLHACAVKKGFSSDNNIRTALMAVYCKWGDMGEAFRLFLSIGAARNVVSWTALICGHLNNGRLDRAAEFFLRMRRIDEAKPNKFTLSAVLTASPVIFPEQIHCEAIKFGLETAGSVGTALVRAYADLGRAGDAIRVFSCIADRDVVCWSAMVAAHAQAGDSDSATWLFLTMTRQGVSPNEFTLSSLIHSCAAPAAAAEQGKQFHTISIRLGLEAAVCVSSALVTMYSKKGAIDSASSIFHRQPERDLVAWNSMVCGCAQHGHARMSLQLFQEMVRTGLKPDGVTFVGVLSACTHAGLVAEGREFFDAMSASYGIAPGEEHLACMVDLYSRAGRFEEAMEMVDRSPAPVSAAVWRTLLGHCRTHKKLELGIVAAEKLIAMEPSHSAAYVLLSNMYAMAGRWAERAAVRRRMEAGCVKKEAGQSWIEAKNRVVSFVSGDNSHSFSGDVYARLQQLMCRLRAAGYVPETELVLQDVEEEEQKEAILEKHSEKLALAFGLMVLPKEAPLQIVKNLRVCGDCHSVFKLASALEGRTIVLRDSARFHHFKEGYCSCQDYW
ncbi:tetratricopeptide repeat (TPR)-like superfamily protein [Wolffia australiana]